MEILGCSELGKGLSSIINLCPSLLGIKQDLTIDPKEFSYFQCLSWKPSQAT